MLTLTLLAYLFGRWSAVFFSSQQLPTLPPLTPEVVDAESAAEIVWACPCGVVCRIRLEDLCGETSMEKIAEKVEKYRREFILAHHTHPGFLAPPSIAWEVE